jgi:3-dehydroquinate dehydratase
MIQRESLSEQRDQLRRYAETEQTRAQLQARNAEEAAQEAQQIKIQAEYHTSRIRNTLVNELETQTSKLEQVHIAQVGELVDRLQHTQASERQVLAGAEAATRVQHALMDELRQQTVDAENAHLTVVKSAEIEIDQLRRALSRKDEGATRQFDEMRSELGAEARKVISDRDQQIQALNEKLVAIQRAAIERDDRRMLESQAQVAELAPID